ncbi:citryl-CoA lyase [Candidatus Uhrbacteria bacterium]|nr:citryl-CoA lyase [Candidatus Uhrbacteria bacterium]
MKWRTAISEVEHGKESIRGYELTSLMAKKSFSDVVFLVLRGTLPSAAEARMMDALLVACIDHGIGVASAVVSRLTASTGNSLHTALASGILAFGKLHGGAAQDAAEFFSSQKDTADIDVLIGSLKEKKIRVPGYGHKVLLEDSRVTALCAKARELGFFGTYCEFALMVEKSLNAVSSKKLPLNIDGALAAVLLDMGFDPIQARGVFLIGRVPGLIAHIHEEMTQGPGLRRLREDEYEYTGGKNKKI